MSLFDFAVELVRAHESERRAGQFSEQRRREKRVYVVTYLGEIREMSLRDYMTGTGADFERSRVTADPATAQRMADKIKQSQS